jgi:DEAD/DEAH box helicase domain-containing protein
MLLDVLQDDGFLRRAGDDRYYWSQENFPASAFSLRSAAQENVVIIDETGDRPRVIGEVDLFAAPMLVHEKAIYIHAGRQFHVDRLDWDDRKAYIHAVDVDYYTDADLGVTLKVLDAFDEVHGADDALRAHGEVMVAWHATLYKKIKLHTHENVGWGPITLPEQQMHTTGAWIVPPTALVNRFDRETLDGALIGLSRVARAAAALLLMCDPRDIGVLAQVQAPHTRRPTLFMYDAVPGGVGLAERLHELNAELVAACERMVRDCPCMDGCPSCVGPVAEVGVRGKAACGELLAGLA